MNFRELEFLRSNINPFRLFKTYPLKEWEVMPYHGIHIFEGQQGSGKTLSMIRFIKQITSEYKDVKVLSNVDIGDIDYIEWNKPNEMIKFIRENNLKGVLLVIDEINVVFPSTDKPSREFMELICMLRHFEIYCLRHATSLHASVKANQRADTLYNALWYPI